MESVNLFGFDKNKFARVGLWVTRQDRYRVGHFSTVQFENADSQ
jgi:hypothetical protein